MSLGKRIAQVVAVLVVVALAMIVVFTVIGSSIKLADPPGRRPSPAGP